jgi:hypothetical protein
MTASLTNTVEQANTLNFTGANQISITAVRHTGLVSTGKIPAQTASRYSRDNTASGRVEGTETFSDGTANPFGSCN